MIKKKRRRAINPDTRQLVLQIVSGVVVFGVVVLILTGIWYGTRVSTLTLETITVEGGQTISHAQVREAVAGTLEGSYFGLIPKRFAWTYPEAGAMAAAANISRVKNPNVERVSGTELRVVVDEYLPFALWCTQIEEHKCLFIDKEGTAFAPAPVLDGGSMYRFYTIGDEPEIGKVLEEKGALQEVIKFADALESDFNLPISKIELDTVGDVFYQVVGGGEIKATTEQPAQKLQENLALVLSTDDFKDLEAGTFLYIDLRFGNKVFVNDVISEVSTTTEDAELSSNNIGGEEEVNILDTVIQEMTRTVANDGEEEQPIDAVLDGAVIAETEE